MRLRGLATGIGSLPFTDADTAVDKVLSNVPQIPFWPQLPKRDAKEGMIAQFSEHMPCLRARNGDVVFCPEDKDTQLERFYEKVIAQDTEYFSISPDYAAGLYAFYRKLSLSPELLAEISCIKCHITGPFTFAASVKDESGVALMHDEVFMQTVVAGLTMKALWQVKLFETFRKKIIVFLDEPFLASFGSAYTSLNRETVVKTLSDITFALRRAGALSGVHCCGNTDWSMFTDIETLDIINFDAFGFMEKIILYAPQLKDFLRRGGLLCWGIVPTQDYSDAQTPDKLVRIIEEGIKILTLKGVDESMLAEQLLISPSCGLGALPADKAAGILKLLHDTSALLRTS